MARLSPGTDRPARRPPHGTARRSTADEDSLPPEILRIVDAIADALALREHKRLTAEQEK
jgi:hypothetical protein